MKIKFMTKLISAVCAATMATSCVAMPVSATINPRLEMQENFFTMQELIEHLNEIPVHENDDGFDEVSDQYLNSCVDAADIISNFFNYLLPDRVYTYRGNRSVNRAKDDINRYIDGLRSGDAVSRAIAIDSLKETLYGYQSIIREILTNN